MKPPLRLRDDPRVLDGLRAELGSSWESAHGYDVASGLGALQRTLAGRADAASAEPAGRSLRRFELTSLPARLTLVAAAGAAVVSLTWTGLPSRRSERASRQPSAAHQVAAKPTAAVEPAAIPPPQEAAGAREEIELTVRLRALVERDPNEALRLAERMEREFPLGALAEEREALQIVAHARRGDAQAFARAAAFLRRHPHSGMRARLEPLIVR